LGQKYALGSPRPDGSIAPNPVIRSNQETDCSRTFWPEARMGLALSNSLDFIGELSIILLVC
jgi:hypothetical protein